MFSSPASKVSERHSALVLNIGTFAKEDEAYELLNILSVSLPFVVMITTAFDALLATAYLKWFHPWKTILQEVFTSLLVLYNFLQEPDSWHLEEDEEEGVDQGKKKVSFQRKTKMKSIEI